VFKWFAYLDIVAGTSGRSLHQLSYNSAVSFIEDITENRPTESFKPSKFDTFPGFTSRLLPLLFRIGRLAHDKRVASSTGINLNIDLDFLIKVNEVEVALIDAEFDTINSSSEPFIGAQEKQQLERACKKALHFAARLHIQRRLRNMSSE